MFSGALDFSLLLLIFSLGSLIILGLNILNFILLCEIIWINFYFYLILLGINNDSLSIISWVLCFLCLATGGSTIGLSLLMLKFTLDGRVGEPYGVGNEKAGVAKGWNIFWNK